MISESWSGQDEKDDRDRDRGVGCVGWLPGSDG